MKEGKKTELVSSALLGKVTGILGKNLEVIVILPGETKNAEGKVLTRQPIGNHRFPVVDKVQWLYPLKIISNNWKKHSLFASWNNSHTLADEIRLVEQKCGTVGSTGKVLGRPRIFKASALKAFYVLFIS